jgi:hypothetical protein
MKHMYRYIIKINRPTEELVKHTILFISTCVSNHYLTTIYIKIPFLLGFYANYQHFLFKDFYLLSGKLIGVKFSSAILR